MIGQPGSGPSPDHHQPPEHVTSDAAGQTFDEMHPGWLRREDLKVDLDAGVAVIKTATEYESDE